MIEKFKQLIKGYDRYTATENFFMYFTLVISICISVTFAVATLPSSETTQEIIFVLDLIIGLACLLIMSIIFFSKHDSRLTEALFKLSFILRVFIKINIVYVAISIILSPLLFYQWRLYTYITVIIPNICIGVTFLLFLIPIGIYKLLKFVGEL